MYLFNSLEIFEILFILNVACRLGRPLTLSEKILYGHLDDAQGSVSNLYCYFIKLHLDRLDAANNLERPRLP